VDSVSVILIVARYVPSVDTRDILWAVGGLVLLIVVGTFIILRIRRSMQEDEPPAVGGTPFTLHDLRQLHKAGRLSDDEYEAARARIIAMVSRESEADSPEDRETVAIRPPSEEEVDGEAKKTDPPDTKPPT
jgi:hypothetical protein